MQLRLMYQPRGISFATDRNICRGVFFTVTACKIRTSKERLYKPSNKCHLNCRVGMIFFDRGLVGITYYLTAGNIILCDW